MRVYQCSIAAEGGPLCFGLRNRKMAGETNSTAIPINRNASLNDIVDAWTCTAQDNKKIETHPYLGPDISVAFP